MPRVILHVDMDSFYPSVEKRVNPELRDKPVIVVMKPTGSPLATGKITEGRGVVASCSYEARKFGVRSGMPVSRAYRLCPTGVYLQPNFPLYEEVSGRVMEILRRHGDRFEQVSIDEAYLDVSGRVGSWSEAEELALKIKREIKEKEGLTCSIGVAPNKSLAKIASDRRKPDGLTVVRREDVKAFLEPLPVKEIPGVGRVTREALEKLGVKTVGELARYPNDKLVGQFGKHGQWIWDVANGVDESEVEEVLEAKSLSSEKTFEEDIEDWNIIYRTLDTMTEEVHSRAQQEGYQFKTVGIKIIFQDFEIHTRSKSLQEYTDTKSIITEYAKSRFKEFEADTRKIRKVGLRISNLRRKSYVEVPLDRYI